MIMLVIVLACGFVGEVSAPEVPMGSDVVLDLQAEPELRQPPAEPVWRNLGPGGGGWIQSICASPQRSGELLVGPIWEASIARRMVAPATPSRTPASRATSWNVLSPIP
jgi:hypothetical protein